MQPKLRERGYIVPTCIRKGKLIKMFFGTRKHEVVEEIQFLDSDAEMFGMKKDMIKYDDLVNKIVPKSKESDFKVHF